MRGSGHPVRVLIARLAVCRCTLVALLPVLPQSPWFHEHVQCAHEIHYLRSGVAFANPFMDNTLGAYILGFIVAIWRPGPPPRNAPRWQASAAVPAGSAAEEPLALARCVECRKWRVLPLHVGAARGGVRVPRERGRLRGSPNIVRLLRQFVNDIRRT